MVTIGVIGRCRVNQGGSNRLGKQSLKAEGDIVLQLFENRSEGGRTLAERLAGYKNRKDVVVLALPRGGVPVAFEVAKALNAPLDVLLVRKLGVPGHEELAFGAIASGGIKVFNEALVNALNLPVSMIEEVIGKETEELDRRETIYRRGRGPFELDGKTVIIVDDGLATGATMRAAITAVRTLKPKRIIAAAPVASRETCEGITHKSDDLCICSETPEPFYGVGMWYRDFGQTSDDEVCRLLSEARNAIPEVFKTAN